MAVAEGDTPEAMRIRAAVRADFDAIVGVLCRAFDADPVTNWLLRQDAGREAAFSRFYRLSLSLVFPYGQVFVTEGVRGVALWAPPGRWGSGWWQQVLQLPGFVRSVGLRRLPARMPHVLALEARHPRSPAHFYLFGLAVDPAMQGQGIGGALLRHVLERCDRERIPAYLESSTPRNKRLYERHGFKVTERFVLGPDGPPVWLMWRDPQAD